MNLFSSLLFKLDLPSIILQHLQINFVVLRVSDLHIHYLSVTDPVLLPIFKPHTNILSSDIPQSVLDQFQTQLNFEFSIKDQYFRVQHHRIFFSEPLHLFHITNITAEMPEMVARSNFGAQDTLTGLYRRSVLYARADQLIRLNRPFHLLFVDLDKFKQVNDTLGHSTGDNVLRLCARAIQSQLRPSDLCIRFGGDEFCVLLQDVRSSQTAFIVQQRIENAVCEAASSYGVRASIGSASFPADAIQFERILEMADSRMYSSKLSKKP